MKRKKESLSVGALAGKGAAETAASAAFVAGVKGLAFERMTEDDEDYLVRHCLELLTGERKRPGRAALSLLAECREA